MEKDMNANEITTAVEEYLRDDMMKYAIMINGAWGVGKTHLYFNDLRPVIYKNEIGKTKPRKDIYISLYGLSSIDELARSILYKVKLWNKEDDADFETGELLFGIADTIIRSTTIQIKKATINLEKIVDKLYGLMKTNRLVICFDDFERCSIPINVLLGYINNLIEHCDCKVIILADERNIGIMYANTNIELKYQTVLSGGKKLTIVPDGEEDNLDEDKEISIKKLKQFTNELFSENYIYSEIKEKVVGRTYFYFPDLEETVKSILKKKFGESDDENAAIQSYGKFLKKWKGIISDEFGKMRCRNARTIIYWINKFEKIYKRIEEKKTDLKHYDEIANRTICYSIMVEVGIATSKEIKKSRYVSKKDMYYLEGIDSSCAYKIDVIDDWFIKSVYIEAEVDKAIYDLEKKIEEKDKETAGIEPSSGKWLAKLLVWEEMDSDSEVVDAVGQLIQELKENKYVFEDYHSIIDLLSSLSDYDLYSCDLNSIKEIMIKNIKKDKKLRSTERAKLQCAHSPMRYRAIFSSLIYERELQNSVVNKQQSADYGIYTEEKRFKEYCENNKLKFMEHRSFTQYVNVDGIIELIRHSSNKEIYDIADALSEIYYMDNVMEIYPVDKEDLSYLYNELLKEISGNDNIGKVRIKALKEVTEMIGSILDKMGDD